MSKNNSTNASTTKRKYKTSRDAPVIMFDPINNRYHEMVDGEIKTDVSYEKDKGSRVEVMQGIAFRTKGLKRKSEFIVSDDGRIKSLTKHNQGKIHSNLTDINKQRSNKTFEFYFKNNLKFECILEKKTCSKEGCNKKNDYPIEFCIPHLKSEMNLSIKPTTLERNIDGGTQKIRGHGLFAWNQDIIYDTRRENKIIFREDDLICFYYGKTLSPIEVEKHNDEKNHPHAQRPYSLQQGSVNEIIDSSCLRGIGSFANHKSNSNANAIIVLRKHPQTGKMMSCLVTNDKKIIRNGDEIFVDYGYQPHIRFQDYQYETTNVDYEREL